MAKATTEKEEFKPLTCTDVAGWFEEYMEGKQRQRPIPDAQQCLPISEYINEQKHLRSALRTIKLPADQNTVMHLVSLNRQAMEEAAVLQRTLQRLLSQISLIKEEDTELKEFSEKQEVFLQAVKDYLVDRMNRKPGKPENIDPFLRISIPKLRLKIEAALKNAGWRTVSFTQNGPAPYVLAKCLEYLGNRPIDYKSLSHRLKTERRKTG